MELVIARQPSTHPPRTSSSSWLAKSSACICGAILICSTSTVDSLPQRRLPTVSSNYDEFARPSQKSLSAHIEASRCLLSWALQTFTKHKVIHVHSCIVPGVGVWITAVPNSIDSHIESLLFRTPDPDPDPSLRGNRRPADIYRQDMM